MTQALTPATRITRGRPRGFDREVALQKAMRVFWEKGFSAASMADLTAAMGINAPSLYAAFGSKEGLYAEVLDQYAQMAEGMNRAIYENGQPIRDQVEAALGLSARTDMGCGLDAAQRPMGCMIIMASDQSSELSADLVRALGDKRRGPRQALAERLQRAVATGELPASVDIERVADFYATIQRGLAVNGKGGAGADEMEGVVRTAMAVWAALTERPDQL